MAQNIELISGATTQDRSFPVWTTTTGCVITKYEIDNDSDATSIIASSGVALKAGCADPCNTVTFTTTTVGSVTFFIRATAEGTGNSAYSTQVTVNIVCGALSSSQAIAVPASGLTT